jgi:pyruvate dehydrogenase (quinone)
MSDPRKPGWDRRDVFLAATAGVAAALASQNASASPSISTDAITPQPTPFPGENVNTSDILIETLIDWGATHVFGIVGDGINPIIEALRNRQDRIRFIPVRHEESAAFMASGFAKHTGRLGVCVGTTGPGAIHLSSMTRPLMGLPWSPSRDSRFMTCAVSAISRGWTLCP